MRKPLPTEVRASLQEGFDKLVAEFESWHATDEIDSGHPLRYQLSLSIEFPQWVSPNGPTFDRGFQGGKKGSFPKPKP